MNLYEDNFIPTLNNTGYVCKTFDYVTNSFIEHAAESKKFSLEIGAGYGFVCKKILEKGGKIICNDLATEHLEQFVNSLTEALKKNLILKPGRFPFDIDLEPISVKYILLSRVMHFFTPQEIKLSLERIRLWLIDGGKCFIIVDTPFCGNLKSFLPIFEYRKKMNALWPGIMKSPKKYISNYSDIFPNYLHFFDKETFSREVIDMGFKIQFLEYLARKDYPIDRQLDGRECLGIIIEK